MYSAHWILITSLNKGRGLLDLDPPTSVLRPSKLFVSCFFSDCVICRLHSVARHCVNVFVFPEPLAAGWLASLMLMQSEPRSSGTSPSFSVKSGPEDRPFDANCIFYQGEDGGHLKQPDWRAGA